MNTKVALARALVRNTDLPVQERRQRLNQLTADVRQDSNKEITRLRTEITALRTTGIRALWQTVVGVVTRVPFSRTTGLAAIANLRIQLAEAHTARFAALAELKILKALA